MLPTFELETDRKITTAKKSTGRGGVYRGKGHYYGPDGTPSTGTPPSNQLAMAPLNIDRVCLLQALVAEVTTVGSAGALVRLGVYTDDGSGLFPSALVVDAGTIDATVLGNSTITLGTAIPLAPGRYWVGGVTQGAPSTLPIMRIVGVNGGVIMPSSTASASNANTGAAQNSVSGALPSTFTTTLGFTSAVTRVALQLT
jgi:hypothetical protein